MKYCKICLEPSTRPGAKFDSSGVCSTCKAQKKHDQKNDDQLKQSILNQIFNKYKKTPKQYYDCILGVSGGSDSTRLALWLKEKFNKNPLLVCCTYPPDQITETGANNLSNLIRKGFDVIVTAPGPQTWKKFLKKGFFDGNYLRGPEIALYSSLPQIAIKYNIKLIFWGEGGGTTKNFDEKINNPLDAYDGNNLRYSNTLKECKLNWTKNLIKDRAKLIPYTYPTESEFKKNKLQIIYLGNFWDKQAFTYTAISSSLQGLSLRKDKPSNTGDLFGMKALDEDWVIINQMIKYLKYGNGRATDYLNYDIRQGNISRADAVKIVSKYDGRCNEKYINSFCEYLGIKKNIFWKIIYKHHNKKLFKAKKVKNKIIFKPRFKVGIGIYD